MITLFKSDTEKTKSLNNFVWIAYVDQYREFFKGWSSSVSPVSIFSNEKPHLIKKSALERSILFFPFNKNSSTKASEL